MIKNVREVVSRKLCYANSECWKNVRILYVIEKFFHFFIVSIIQILKRRRQLRWKGIAPFGICKGKSPLLPYNAFPYFILKEVANLLDNFLKKVFFFLYSYYKQNAFYWHDLETFFKMKIAMRIVKLIT